MMYTFSFRSVPFYQDKEVTFQVPTLFLFQPSVPAEFYQMLLSNASPVYRTLDRNMTFIAENV